MGYTHGIAEEQGARPGRKDYLARSEAIKQIWGTPINTQTGKLHARVSAQED